MITATKARELYLKSHETYEIELKKLGDLIQTASISGKCFINAEYNSFEFALNMYQCLQKAGYSVIQTDRKLTIRW